MGGQISVKLCILCKESEAYRSGENQYSYCKVCQARVSKKWRDDNKEFIKTKKQEYYKEKSTAEKRRISKYIQRYGITLDDFLRMEEEQGGVCAICCNPPVGHKKVLCVDHDHSSGKVRGLLCDDCNNMLGRAKDDEARLIGGAIYLEYWSKQ